MTYRSTKTFGPEVGLSCAFRQWRAASHCRFLHGYPLSFTFVFEARMLDEQGWVVDFGGLKDLKLSLQHAFDHTTAVAADDPHLAYLEEAARLGAIDLRVLPEGVGCERFAEYAWRMADRLIAARYGDRVTVISCECREHGANSAIFVPASAEAHAEVQ
jgi:6-pyruvoyltetrahydropterin/6-carboxytetrahydropterin synthase